MTRDVDRYPKRSQPASVWKALSAERRNETVQVLARLAYRVVIEQRGALRTAKGGDDGATDIAQNPG